MNKELFVQNVKKILREERRQPNYGLHRERRRKEPHE